MLKGRYPGPLDDGDVITALTCGFPAEGSARAVAQCSGYCVDAVRPRAEEQLLRPQDFDSQFEFPEQRLSSAAAEHDKAGMRE